MMRESINLKAIEINKKVLRKNAFKTDLFVYSIIGTQLISFVIFYIFTNINSFLMAFQTRIESGKVIWTMQNFVMMFESFANGGEIFMALRNTLIYFGVGFVLTPFHLLPAYFLYKKIWGHKFFRIIFFFPSIVSAVVWSFLYSSLLGPVGPIAPLFQKLFHLEDLPIFLADSKYALGAVIIYTLWTTVPGSFVIYSGTITRIPESVIEAGKLEGVGWFRELYQLILPMMWPTVATNILLGLTGIFTSSGNLLLLTGGGYNTNSISFYIFQQVYGLKETSNTYNYASAIGLFFTVVALPIVFISQKLMNRVEDIEY